MEFSRMPPMLLVLCLFSTLPQAMSSSASSATPDVVSAEWLAKHKNSVVILDVSYQMKPKTDPAEFKEKYYGRFEEIMAEKPNNAYVSEHIPGAVHYNLDAAYYPSEYIRFDLYPPKEFEKYIRLLGVDAGDHVVLYGRESMAGMLWPARAWWTFKVYGHENVSVLDGGLDAWKKAGQAVTSDVTKVKRGNWSAKPLDTSRMITFEELDKKNADGLSLFDDLSKINYLDARTAPQFTGAEALAVPAPGATGSHLKGAKSVPLALVVSQHGLKSAEEIMQALKKAKFDDSLPTVTACNTAIQASLLALALSRAGVRAKVFNGSMAEIGLRAPQLISERG